MWGDKEVLFSVPSVALNAAPNVVLNVVNSVVPSVHRLIILVLMLVTHRQYQEEYSEKLELSSDKNNLYSAEKGITAGFLKK